MEEHDQTDVIIDDEDDEEVVDEASQDSKANLHIICNVIVCLFS